VFLFYPISQLATPFITSQLSVPVLPDQSARSNVPTPPHVKSTSLLVTRGIHLLAWSRGLYATRTPLLYQSPIKSTKKKIKKKQDYLYLQITALLLFSIQILFISPRLRSRTVSSSDLTIYTFYIFFLRSDFVESVSMLYSLVWLVY